jgi:hypothetical protein
LPTQSTQDEDDKLFIQELKGRYENLQDGVHYVDEIPDKNCKSLLEELLSPGATDIISGLESLYERRKLLKDFGLGGRFYIKTVRGKRHIIFKGWAGLRKHFNYTHCKISKPSVLHLTAGLKGTMKAFAKEQVESLRLNPFKPEVCKEALKKGGFGLNIILVAGYDILEFFFSKEKDFSDLLVKLGFDIAEAVVNTLAQVGAIALAGMISAATGLAVPVLVVIVGSIVVGYIAGEIFEFATKRSGFRRALENWADEIEDEIRNPTKRFLDDDIFSAYAMGNL